jgi:hypothetical protein
MKMQKKAVKIIFNPENLIGIPTREKSMPF